MAASNIGFLGMLHQIYNSIGVIASAVGHGAKALDNIGMWAEEQTGTFVDEARLERQAKVEDIQRRMAQAKRRADHAALNDSLVIEAAPASAPITTPAQNTAATPA